MTTLRSALAVILDEAACPDCGGTGRAKFRRIPGTVISSAADPCPTCHGAGLAGDLDPHTLARLTRWATYSRQGREMVAACLPGARVAGAWALQYDNPERWCRWRLLGEGTLADAEWRRTTDGRHAYRAISGEQTSWHPTLDAARRWCDEQLRAAGWVLVGGAEEAPCPECGDIGGHEDRGGRMPCETCHPPPVLR